MSFGAWNGRSLNGEGSLTAAAARELARYKLDSVGVHEVRCVKGSTERAGDYNFFLWERKSKSSMWNRILCTTQIGMAVEIVGFVSDRVSCIVLRGCWCNILVLNVLAPSEEIGDDSKVSKSVFFMRNKGRVFIIFINTI